ncbi:hypothetical protein [Candidatus Nitrosotalea bavarica]|uniref:hypothetical protein n=1 Tax=Candidatus Nitrosotalea bavarica TaxID=1903277 RepID=UPI000C70267A|nr:hypothetical protein [Candidatus Nitrosotalea bavarica]
MIYISGQPVTLIIKSPIGNIVHLEQVPLGSDRTYSTSVDANTALWQSLGMYQIQVQFGSNSNTAQTTFQFSGSSGGTTTTTSGITISTDKTSYNVGDIVKITGSGFPPNNLVVLTGGGVLTIQADGNGNFATSWGVASIYLEAIVLKQVARSMVR